MEEQRPHQFELPILGDPLTWENGVFVLWFRGWFWRVLVFCLLFHFSLFVAFEGTLWLERSSTSGGVGSPLEGAVFAGGAEDGEGVGRTWVASRLSGCREPGECWDVGVGRVGHPQRPLWLRNCSPTLKGPGLLVPQPPLGNSGGRGRHSPERS